MSGLCGIVHFRGGSVDRRAVQRMAEAAAHRGPDGIRCRMGAQAGFAHLALHVAPADRRAPQPHAEGALTLVADVRLDNRADLIRTLVARGHVADQALFSDAALLLAAYRCWGADCAAHLLGDFAFAIWDARRQRLVAARDPMAMRPLYYRSESGRILFASEVKQLLAAPGVPARLSEPAIAAHLAGRFEASARTFYEGIAQLQPGHVLVADADGCRTQRYWDIDPARRITYRDEQDYAEHFQALFEEAVRCRLQATAPVGLMLSGGLDSTCIAATAGRLMERDARTEPSLRTYSWAFEELTQCDERAVSDPIVQRYGLPATSIDAEAAAPLEQFPADRPDADEPFAGVYDALVRRTLAVAHAEGTRQMLTGHRGDLVMGEWIFNYLGLLRTGRWRTLGRALHAHTRRTGMSWSATVRRYLAEPLREALWPKGRAAWMRALVRRAYRTLRPAPPPSLYPAWVRPAFAARTGLNDEQPPMRVPAGLRGHARRQRYRAALMPMHMRTATRFERDCARAGLTCVDPWSDRRLVAFALAVPPRVLCRAGENKRLARTAMRGVMPEAARCAARKTSPKPLYERALRLRACATVRHLINDSRAAARGYVDERALHACYDRYLRGAAGDDRFWYTLTLEMWLRQREAGPAGPARGASTQSIRSTP